MKPGDKFIAIDIKHQNFTAKFGPHTVIKASPQYITAKDTTGEEREFPANRWIIKKVQ